MFGACVLNKRYAYICLLMFFRQLCWSLRSHHSQKYIGINVRIYCLLYNLLQPHGPVRLRYEWHCCSPRKYHSTAWVWTLCRVRLKQSMCHLSQAQDTQQLCFQLLLSSWCIHKFKKLSKKSSLFFLLSK